MDFDTDIKPKLTLLARHGLSLLAGALLPMGVLSKTTEGAFIDAGVAVTLLCGALVWSFIQKELQKKSVQAALATPVAGTFSLDQAATMLAPLIQQVITDALPSPPPTLAAPAADPPVAAATPIMGNPVPFVANQATTPSVEPLLDTSGQTVGSVTTSVPKIFTLPSGPQS